MDNHKIFFRISGIEALAAGFYLLAIPGDPKNSILFGLSISRLINLGMFFSLALTLFALGFWLHRIKLLEGLLLQLTESLVKWQKSIWVAVSLMLAIGIFPAHKIKDFELIWERLLPSVVLALGVLLNYVILMVFEGREKGYFLNAELRPAKPIMRNWLILLAISGILVIIIWSTRFGIIPPINRYWNTAGVPVLPEQVLYLVFGYIFLTGLKAIKFSDQKWNVHPWMMFLLFWVISFIIWNAQPIARSYFVYQPAAPNHEYYPLSDAQRFDFGGQLMLAGQGILNGMSEEKPFEMAYLAVLQVLTGKDYVAMASIQVLLLSLTTPLLYLIGRKLYSEKFGAALAVMGILYEVNTINSSVNINSAHVKLLLSEPVMMLGVVAITYSLLCWMEDLDRKVLGVITLGLIGLFTYVRANVLLLYFAAFGLIVLSSLPKFIKGVQRFLWANVGFLGVVLPWMIYAYNRYGYLTIINKFKFIIQHRILAISPQLGPAVAKLPRLIISSSRAKIVLVGDFWESIYLQAAHLLNNLIKSLLIFPMNYQIRNISEILDQPYWDETVIWDGSVSVIILVNLAVILLGLAFLIGKNKLLGAAPLVVMIFYNLASALAMTSGGRYLKPSIWVFTLYFLAGIFFLLDRLFLAVQFTPVTIKPKPRPDSQISQGKTNRSMVNIAAVFLIGIGLFVPIADAAIPQQLPDISLKNAVSMFPEDAVDQIGLDGKSLLQLVQEKDLEVFYGTAQYPRQVVPQKETDYFGFSVVGPLPSIRARLFIERDPGIVFSPDSLVVAVGCNKQVGNLRIDDMVLVFLVEENLVYSLGSDWREYCPIPPGD